jgi:hypothetical protein
MAFVLASGRQLLEQSAIILSWTGTLSISCVDGQLLRSQLFFQAGNQRTTEGAADLKGTRRERLRGVRAPRAERPSAASETEPASSSLPQRECAALVARDVPPLPQRDSAADHARLPCLCGGVSTLLGL